MAWPAAGGCVIDLRLAGESDDADLRTMLRTNSMPSWVAMSLEREPSVLASLNRFGRECAVIARDGATPVGMYLCADHPVHINGLPVSFGYLGGLRVNPSYRHRLRVLREGYASIRELSGVTCSDNWYTAIATENVPARRLLEAKLRDLPVYVAEGEMLTLAISRERGKRLGIWRNPDTKELDSMCVVHNKYAVRHQLSPELTPERVSQTGARFFVRDSGKAVSGCMALWDQTAYKQVVARAYRQPLAVVLPLYNAWARMTRRITLPRLNQQLDQSFLAFFAPGSEDPAELVPMIRDALAICTTKVLTLGFHAAHPAIPDLIRVFQPALYRSIVYSVCFAERLLWDGRPVQPEVAIL